MELSTLHELYVDELKDLYSAENQILKALPKMIRATTHRELKDAFIAHMKQTENQVKRLEHIFASLDASPKGKKCHGMEGVLEEGAELIRERPEPQVLDAGLISAAQHVEHYEMAGYGTVRAWADKLGRDEDAKLLQETLDEEREADEKLTELATRAINIEADREVVTNSDREVGVATTREAIPSARARSKTGRTSDVTAKR
jgi:ferritin-like metal-binding protein YciE